MGSQQASARTTYSGSWDIKLTQVATGVPYYSTYTPVNLTNASSGSTYNLKSNCAIVQLKYNSNIANTWVWVDYNNVDDYKLVDFQVIGSYCYSTVALPNLTPGTHQIQVRAASPDYISSAIKYDIINVTVPTATTTSAVTVN